MSPEVLPERRNWAVLAALCIASGAGMAYLIAPASVLPVVMTQLGVTPTEAGWVISAMFGIQAVASIPAGLSLDRLDNRIAITGASLVLAVAGLWGWYSVSVGSFEGLLASRVVGGIANVVVWNGAANVIGRMFPSGDEATALGMFTASAPAGFALGQLTGPQVLNSFGLGGVFAVYGAIGLAGLGCFLALTARMSGWRPDPRSSTPGVLDFRRVVGSYRVWYVAVLGFLAYSLYTFLNSWMPTYMSEIYNLSLAESGLAIAIFPAVGVVSRSVGGMLSDRYFESRRRPVILGSFLFAFPCLVAIIVAPSAYFVVGALVLVGLFIQMSIGLFYVYVRELVQPNVAGTAISFLTAVSVLGSFTSPLIGGFLIQRLHSYLPAFLYAVLITAVGVLLAWFAPKEEAIRG